MADEITDAEIADLRRFAAHPAGYHMSKEVLAGLLARLERVERERDEARAALPRWREDRMRAEIAAGDVPAGGYSWQSMLEAINEIDNLRARIATLERELSRWRGCEQVEGDYVCKHEFECSQILRPRIATLEAALLPLAAHARSEAMRAAEGSERKRIMDKWATAAETALRGVEGKP